MTSSSRVSRSQVYQSYGFAQEGGLVQPEHMKYWVKPEFLSRGAIREPRSSLPSEGLPCAAGQCPLTPRDGCTAHLLLPLMSLLPQWGSSPS